MDHYRLVSCDFHDQLEALATLRQECQITYRDESNQTIEVRDRIVDIYAENHADFLKLKNGIIIRLDQIISVNDQPITYANLE